MGLSTSVETQTPAEQFIERWSQAQASERANYAMFLAELCDLLAVPRPSPSTADDAQNTYVFEKAVTFPNADGTISVP